MNAPRDSRRTRLWLAAVLLVGFAVYAPSIANDFTFDDAYYAKAIAPGGVNPMVAELRPLHEYFAKPMGYGVHDNTRSYRPVTVLSYAVIHRVFRTLDETAPGGVRDPPWPQHLANALLHVLATLLVYLLTRRLTSSVPALLAATVFSLHAIRSDVVASIVGRGELLGFVFGAGAMLLATWPPNRERVRRAMRLTIATALAFLAFCSKENALGWAVVIPAFVAVAQIVRDPAIPIRSVLVRIVPAALVVLPGLVAFFVLRGAMLAELATEFTVDARSNPLFDLGFFERLPSATMLLGYGLWKVIAPFHLASDYGPAVFRLADSFSDMRVLAALIALLALAVVPFARVRRTPLLAIGAFTFFGFALITSNIPVPIETLFAERHFYPSALVASFAVAAIASRATSATWRRVSTSVLVLWLAASSVMCIARSLDWRNDETLLTADVAGQPRSVLLKLSLADLRRRAGRLDEAERLLRDALALNPKEAMAAHQLAGLFLDRRTPGPAIPILEATLEGATLDPNARVALSLELARAFEMTGASDDARRTYRSVLEIAPKQFLARNRLCAYARRDSDWKTLEALVREGELHTPTSPTTRMYRGMLEHRSGDFTRAVASFQASLDKIPGTVDNAVGWLAYVEALRAIGNNRDVPKVIEACLEQLELTPALRARFQALQAGR